MGFYSSLIAWMYGDARAVTAGGDTFNYSGCRFTITKGTSAEDIEEDIHYYEYTWPELKGRIQGRDNAIRAAQKALDNRASMNFGSGDI